MKKGCSGLPLSRHKQTSRREPSENDARVKTKRQTPGLTDIAGASSTDDRQLLLWSNDLGMADGSLPVNGSNQP
jgi:hypothetical protein